VTDRRDLSLPKLRSNHLIGRTLRFATIAVIAAAV
jgi:hypothetical protein